VSSPRKGQDTGVMCQLWLGSLISAIYRLPKLFVAGISDPSYK
jgi:hypothetical protein